MGVDVYSVSGNLPPDGGLRRGLIGLRYVRPSALIM